ncbi:MAG: tetratricopeptide repeat protein [Bacteroidetes bacterium]|nr:tetratricopeptide repeat protein [Bacteroidota bacterium]
MTNKYLLIVFLFIFLSAVKGQDPVDSLWSLFEQEQNDTARIKRLLDIAYSLSRTQPDSSLALIDSCSRWSERNSFINGTVRALNLKGVCYWNMRQLEEAETEYKKALQLCRKYNLTERRRSITNNMGILYHQLGQTELEGKYLDTALTLCRQAGDSASMAKVMYDLGNFNSRIGKYAEGLEYLLLAKRMAENLALNKLIVYIHAGIGSLFSTFGNADKALEYYNQAVKLDLANEEVDILTNIYNNLTFLYTQSKVNADSAIKYSFLTLENARSFELPYYTLAVNINMGSLYYKQKEYRKAMVYFRKAEKSPLIKDLLYESAATLTNIGITMIKLDKTDSARYYLDRGMEISKQIEALDFQKLAYYSYYQLDSIKGKYLSASENFRKMVQLHDSIQGLKARNRITELQIMYGLENKEKENQQLATQNELKEKIIRDQKYLLSLIIAGLVIVAALLIIVIIYSRKLRKMNQELRLKNDKIVRQTGEIQEKNRELTRQKNDLQELNAEKDKFFSIVSHDLRNPFQSMKGLLEILHGNYKEMDDASRQRILQTLLTSSHNTYELLDNLLMWARASQGKLSSQPEEIKVESLITAVSDLVRTSVENKEQTLLTEGESSLTIRTDPQLVRIILLNLLTNAVKFTPREGKIILSTKREGGKLIFCITDNGIGIPQEKQSELFRAGSEFRRSGTEKEPGTGLGLIMCRELAHILGGMITLESKENEGSKFCLVLNE